MDSQYKINTPMLNTLSATRQAELIRTGEASVGEILEAHLDKIKASEPAINAFITLDIDGARKKADELDVLTSRGALLGPLHGLTVGIKDSVPVAGLHCTYGSLAFKDYVPDADCAHVANLRDAGAIILGKTNLPELGYGRYGGQTDNAVSGLTRNPWNPDKTVSSSSGGSAAALASYFVALADGSDIAGSIRGPAGWCGLYGLRPTSGVVPNWPKADPLDGAAVVGPLARTADDLALMLDALRTPRKAPLHDIPDPVTTETFSIKGLRVAWCMTPAGSKTSDAVMNALSPMRSIFVSAGAKVIDAEPDLTGLHQAQAILRNFGLLANHGEAISATPELYSAEVNNALEAGKSLTTTELINAVRIRDRAVQVMTAFFDDFDLLIWPTSTEMPFAAEASTEGIHEDWTPLELTPVLQIPALAVPVSKTPDGMPCGVQFIGPKRSDLQLIQLARVLESEIGFVSQYS